MSTDVRRWFGIGLAYLALIYPVSLYHTLHADELLLAYKAALVSRGWIPGLDFLTQEPLAYFLPVAAIYKVLSTSLEAERLILAFLMVVGNVLVASVVWRYRGWFAALVALVLLAFNVPYLSNAMLLNGQTLSYVGLAGAFAAVLLPRRPTWLHYAVAGICVGYALSARLAVALASLAVAAHAFFVHKDRPWEWRRAVLQVLVAALCALLVTLPDVWVILKDPAKLIYVRALVSTDMARTTMLIDTAQGAFALLSGIHLKAYREYFTLGDYHSRYQNMLFPLAVACALLYGVASRLIPRLPRLALVGDDLKWAVIFIAFLMLSYGLTWMQYGDYYNVLYPYMVVVMVALGTRLLACLRALGVFPYRVALLFAIAVFSFHTAQGVAHMVWQVLWRNAPSLGQAQTVNRAACWMEKALASQDQVLTGSPIAAAIAGRDLPAKFENSAALKHWWSDLPPDRQVGLPMLQPSQVGELLENRSVVLIIDDDQLQPVMDYVPNYKDALVRNYTLIGSLGGDLHPLNFYIQKGWLDRKSNTLIPIPFEYKTRMSFEALKNKNYDKFLSGVASDLAQSKETFLTDVSASFARLLRGDWESRCGHFFTSVSTR